jgi:hypothetical protein
MGTAPTPVGSDEGALPVAFDDEDRRLLFDLRQQRLGR